MLLTSTPLPLISHDMYHCQSGWHARHSQQSGTMTFLCCAEDDIRGCLLSKSFQLQQKFLWHPLNRTGEQSNRLHRRWAMQKEWRCVMHISGGEFSLFSFTSFFTTEVQGIKEEHWLTAHMWHETREEIAAPDRLLKTNIQNNYGHSQFVSIFWLIRHQPRLQLSWSKTQMFFFSPLFSRNTFKVLLTFLVQLLLIGELDGVCVGN